MLVSGVRSIQTDVVNSYVAGEIRLQTDSHSL